MAKLKGCRPSDTVGQELTNLFAAYGAASHRLAFTLPNDIKGMEKRITELRAELDEAQKQEAQKGPELVPEAAQETQVEAMQ